MVFSVTEFMKSPTVDEFESLKKDDLIGLGLHLKLDVKSSMRKQEIRNIVAKELLAKEIFSSYDFPVEPVSSETKMSKFEFELEKMKIQLQFEKEEKERQFEREKQERMHERELQFELEKLKLEKDAKENPVPSPVKSEFDAAKNIRLVPKFQEKSVDKYFPHFEKIAANLKWPRDFWPTLLQSVLIGKAAEVYSALSIAESSDYDKVKDTILRAYQLVPEAYRQKFRKYKKFENQTYVEFAREKEDLFDQWFRSKKIPNSFDNLRQIILIEELKECVHQDLRTHLEDKNVKTLEEAAVLSDTYALTHKKNFVSKTQSSDSAKTSDVPKKNICRSLQQKTLLPENDVDREKLLAKIIKPIDIHSGSRKDGFHFHLRGDDTRKILDDDLQSTVDTALQERALDEMKEVNVLELRHSENRGKRDIQIKLDQAKYAKGILDCVWEQQEHYGYNNIYSHYEPSNTVLVEYSSPNIAKPFHAGHLRSTIHGDCISNLYEAHGCRVTRINYLGDWGTQFGLLMYGYQQKGNEDSLHNNAMKHLLEIYVDINKQVAAETESSGDRRESVTYKKGLEMFRRLEQGDEECTNLWQKFKQLSIKEYRDTYKRLNIEFTDFEGESECQRECQDLIHRLEKDKLLHTDQKTSVRYVDGIDHKGKSRKITLLKSDGSSLYLTRDVATAIKRSEKYKFNKMHYVVENGQYQHFGNLEILLKLLGVSFATRLSPADQFHVKFGRVEGLSTRKGDVVLLQDILNEAQERMLQSILQSQTSKDVDDIEETADILGVTGLKVSELRRRRNTNYKFDWDGLLSATKDSGIAMQYTHARLRSLLQKCQDIDLHNNIDLSRINGPIETQLILCMASYEEKVEEAIYTLEPCSIVNYLPSLCNSINSAHKSLRVLNEPREVAEERERCDWTGYRIEIFCYQGRRSYQMSYLGTMPVPATLLSTNFSGFHALETSHKTPLHLESFSLAPIL
ncbi:hypothetical protein FSP39_016214 [Pinctada imbricata]|uniref:Probable arginine--tRNA ligase, mitochondrial n=1 Tax=Pinctada imbricata TaxID=66713 RepID=A0AA89BPG0_PINIB|nr:hypothetical protein FSP39_016214 [Pinctada imbricata]